MHILGYHVAYYRRSDSGERREELLREKNEETAESGQTFFSESKRLRAVPRYMNNAIEQASYKADAGRLSTGKKLGVNTVASVRQSDYQCFSSVETGELFRILYGIERAGDDLTRDRASARKAARAGVGAHRLDKPPIADQMHVVVWVIKANDIRFETGQYREIINFVLHQLRKESE